jgi:P-type E1-E2 ATPase
MAERGFLCPEPLARAATEWQTAGRCVLYAGWERSVHGVFGLAEAARPEAGAALAALRAQRLPVAILTGDCAAAGERWQRRLGVPVHAEQQPDQKLARLRAAAATTPVAMVGDGVNDGPALAAATVGIAMRHGTDVARAAADVVLLRDDVRLVPWLVGLSRRTRRVVRQNLAWAFAYNLAGLALALAGALQPSIAALAMVASSAMVTGNALRLRHYPLPAPVAPADHEGERG